MRRVAIIGGGASGLMAAVAAAENGAEVTVYERNDRVGKKILATGNGKCNFSNTDFSVEDYYGDRKKLAGYFEQFGVEDAVHFFEGAGMLVKERNGYLYPLSEQASTVLDILRAEAAAGKVKIVTDTQIAEIAKNKKNGMFRLHPAAGREEYHAVIIACGGCAAPKTGSDGSGFQLAKSMGHRIMPTAPALVQLRCSDDFFKMVAGVRCEAGLKLYAEDRRKLCRKESGVSEKNRQAENGNVSGEWELLQEERGELQLTDYGISGIPVFQFSRQAAYALQEKRKVMVYIDLLPGMEEESFRQMCTRRMQQIKGRTVEDFLLGMANKKINMMMIKLAGLKPSEAAENISHKVLKKLLYSYKELCVHVSAPNPFENAQVTAGGVPLDEVGERLESVKVPGLYLAGEVLDVDGRCGGYNLQWAWTSGYIAGKSAAEG